MNLNLKQPPQRVLINGCSHSRACIPNLTAEAHYNGSWPRILETMNNYDVWNISQDGKANHYIIEETMRCLYNDYDKPSIVIIQLTDFMRINLFKNTMSGSWVPGVFSTQQGLNMSTKTPYVKLPGSTVNDLSIKRTDPDGGKTKIAIGDKSYLYEQITTLTLLAALSDLCSMWNIKLGILPYFGFNQSVNDVTFDYIPTENWIVDNPENGLYNDLLYYFATPDTYHFEATAHTEIAELVEDWITTGKQVKVNSIPYDNTMKNHMFVYD